MNSSKTQQTSDIKPLLSGFGNLFLPFVSVCALGATFLVAISNLTFEKKITIFFSTIIFYILFCVALYFFQNRQSNFAEIEKDDGTIFGTEVEKQLLALEEASQFFGASLKSADMFRLASSRVREIVPHSTSVLFLVEDVETDLKIISANGTNSREMLAIGQISCKGLAGICLNSKKIQSDKNFGLKKMCFLLTH